MEGAPNSAFESILNIAEERGKGDVNVSRLVADVAINPRPCTFKGSLTTPPCTEGIQWILSKTFVTLSRKQIQRYQAMTDHKHNNRPLQSRNGRPIVCYDNDVTEDAPLCNVRRDPVVPVSVLKQRRDILEERRRIEDERKRIEAARTKSAVRESISVKEYDIGFGS